MKKIKNKAEDSRVKNSKYTGDIRVYESCDGCKGHESAIFNRRGRIKNRYLHIVQAGCMAAKSKGGWRSVLVIIPVINQDMIRGCLPWSKIGKVQCAILETTVNYPDIKGRYSYLRCRDDLDSKAEDERNLTIGDKTFVMVVLVK